MFEGISHALLPSRPMDNEAFRTFVNKSCKSTKEIAREAVETEFRKRKRTKRDDQGYGSDSDDSAPVAKETTRDVAVRDRQEKRGRQTRDKVEYRDRARERREGKSVDYVLLDVHTSTQGGEVTAEDRKRQAELSQYLGGDEEHTHLVKGLDRVLAQKVRREEMGQKDEDLDELMEVALEKQMKEDVALDAEGGLHSIQPQCDLGRHVLRYLLQKQERASSSSKSHTWKVNAALQKSIKRSILTFSLDSDVRKRKHAWDAPPLSIQAFSTNDNVAVQKATPLDRQLITTISNKLRGHLLKAKHGNVTVSKEMQSRSVQDDPAKVDEVANKPMVESDSDDDIFENAGTYIPPSADETTNNEGEQAEPRTETKNIQSDEIAEVPKKKQSIFDNLITKSPETATTTLKVQLQTQQIHTNNNRIINRDVIGASSSSNEPVNKRRGPQTAVMEGYSMSNYDGGYGEEMDVDFGNFDEDDRGRKKDERGDAPGGGGKQKEEENDF